LRVRKPRRNGNQLERLRAYLKCSPAAAAIEVPDSGPEQGRFGLEYLLWLRDYQFWMISPPSQALHSLAAFAIRLPLLAGFHRRQLSYGCGCSSVVEHDLAKVGVEGSSPFARSNIPQNRRRLK
jgi:hypothetical protein